MLPAADVEFAVDPECMRFDRGWGNDQFLGDLPVGQVPG
jgi:hypothetical protein